MRNMISNNSINSNFNQHKGLTPQDDVDMVNLDVNAKSETRNGFSIFDPQDSENVEAQNPKYPSLNSSIDLKLKHFNPNASPKDLIKNNQDQKNPNSNLNAPESACSFNQSGIVPSQNQNVIITDNNNIKSKENLLMNAYYIGLKSKPNNEITVYNSGTNRFNNLKIDESCYSIEDNSYPFPLIFPYENSKYVNIGANSALITGGNSQRTSTDHCYKITISAPSDNNQTEKVNICKYANLLTKRERHNTLFLPDLNQVLVCGGFYVKSCEFTELNGSERKKWKKLPDLAESRGNATMFYLNNRYVYILGGFKVNDSTGEYLNSLEYIDIIKKDKWNFLRIESLGIPVSLRISAMGCVGLGENRILLIGGYDGTSYLKSGFAVDFEDGIVKNFERKDNLLPRGSIFFSNPMFMKVSENVGFNFELQAKPIVYDYQKNEFKFFLQQ